MYRVRTHGKDWNDEACPNCDEIFDEHCLLRMELSKEATAHLKINEELDT